MVGNPTFKGFVNTRIIIGNNAEEKDFFKMNIGPNLDELDGLDLEERKRKGLG